VFTARAASGLVPNDDEERDKYPTYFVVDRVTLRDADEPLQSLERWYNAATGPGVNLFATQGWNKLPDSTHTENVWARLRGSPLTNDEIVQFLGEPRRSADVSARWSLVV
jgi:hypothetical protein